MATRQSLAKLQKELKASVNHKLGTAYKTITQFKKHFGLKTNDEAWEYLDEFDRKEPEIEIKWIKKKQQTFLIHLTLEQQYYNVSNKGKGSWSGWYEVEKTEGPFTEFYPELKLNEMIKKWTFSIGYKKSKVKNSKIEYFNKKQMKAKPKNQIMMKEAYILKNDWLRYSQGICEKAYEETNNTCVYYQLSNFLLNCPTGRPTKFINGKRTSEEALYEFFKNCDSVKYENEFDKFSGVSTMMISELCMAIKRNMYAYDEDDKVFDSVTIYDSKNYCPICFYKLNGHFYLINDPSCFKSIAESNKREKKVISDTIDEKKKEVDLKVEFVDEFDVNYALNLKGDTIYLLSQSNLNKEFIEFIRTHKSIPKVKNNDNVIVKFSYYNKKDEVVNIAVDSNYGDKRIQYEQLKNVAEKNGIKYVNEGIGSVIMNIIERNTNEKRNYLSKEDREQLINKYHEKCAICYLELTKFEIDHIIPLGAGGSNEYDNLQPLCIECHQEKTREENELGIYFVNNQSASCFNKIVIDKVFNSHLFKTWAFVERVNDMKIEIKRKNSKKIQEINWIKNEENQIYDVEVINKIIEEKSNHQTLFESWGLEEPEQNDLYKIDMRKCRRNILYYFNDEFPVYSIFDIPRKFNGIVVCGFYYVKTDNIFPFRGCGWYCQSLVQYGLDNGLILLDEIVMEFIPSKTLPKQHFQKYIDILLNASSIEKDLQKVIINSYIGLFGIRHQTASYSKFSLDLHDASNWWAEKPNVFIRSHQLEEDITLYEGLHKEDVITEMTSYPIYSMILQVEALELHKLEKRISNKGGYILDRNTDAIRYQAKKRIELVDYWDEDKKVLKYQAEEDKTLQVERCAQMKRVDGVKLDDFDLQWNIIYDYDDINERITHIINSNSSFHIDGPAGTGKTYFTNKLIEELDSRGKKYMSFSPTNKGARLINGNTIDSIYHQFKHNKKKLFRMLKGVEYIIIDEVSMMKEIFYQLFCLIKMSTKIKFILTGDFEQFLPVKDTWEGDYKNSPATYFLCEGNRLQLTKCRRSDDELFNIYTNVKDLDISKFPFLEKTDLNLCYTHATRIKINDECQERYLEKYQKPYLHIPKTNDEKTQDVKLCEGMPVICKRTHKKKNKKKDDEFYVLNSEKFIIEKINGDSITIKDDFREITFDKCIFHKYFYLGFCITLHSSQGETFKQKYTIYDSNNYFFNERAMYVALSRATEIKNIQFGI